ncbi:hypothetical protein DPM13_15690 [Paracoccus mutanolyticus]|uniref:Uncharacterized protein n=1 Tax=Paracoccus mutanolyticus TaxID=1499308 RepID=A0ABM6WTD4_9RHOB|nr:hypothetical protein DPM13_15690 [Paracoccus mutanolyticus]
MHPAHPVSRLRALGVTNRIGYFHHIPWPAHDLTALPPALACTCGAAAALRQIATKYFCKVS